VHTEGLLRLDSAMGTGLAVTWVVSRLKFSRVVLDFFFRCHNLKMNSVLGGAPRSFNGQLPPLFPFPKATKNRDRQRATKEGRGPILRKTRAGSKQGSLTAGARLREKRD